MIGFASSFSTSNELFAGSYSLRCPFIDAPHQSAYFHWPPKSQALFRAVKDRQNIEEVAINALKLEHKVGRRDFKDRQPSQGSLNEADLFRGEPTGSFVHSDRPVGVIDDQFCSTQKRLDGSRFFSLVLDSPSNEVTLRGGGLPVCNPSCAKNRSNRADGLHPSGKLVVRLQPSLQRRPPSDSSDHDPCGRPDPKHRKPVHFHLHLLTDGVSRGSIVVEVELHLRLRDHARYVGAVLVPAAQRRHRPVRGARPAINPPHATLMHVRFQASEPRQCLDALDQDLLQLACGTGGFSHFSSIAAQEGR